MIFKTLTQNQTNIWIRNLQRVVNLRELLLNMSKDRIKQRNDEYQKYYRSGWKKVFYEERCWTHSNGKSYEMGSMFFSLTKLTKFTAFELYNLYESGDYREKYQTNYKMTLERWSKYASQPFQIEEKDLVFYQTMKDYHKEALDTAKGLGLDYEAFNLDEDC